MLSARCTPCALLLAACVAPAPAPDSPDLPTPYTYEPADVGDGVDPVVMEAELQSVFDRLRTFHAGAVLDAYEMARDLGDLDCPRETTTETPENGSVVYFEGQCVAWDRYWFKGPMTTYEFQDNTFEAFEINEFEVADAHHGPAWDGRALRGQTDVYDNQSDLDFNCSCTVLEATSLTGSDDHWFSYVDGPNHWVAEDAAESWIDEGLQVRLYVVLDRTARTGGEWKARAVGAVTGATDVYGTIDLDLSISGTRADDGTVSCDAGAASVVMRHTVTGARTPLEFTIDGSCRPCTPVDDGNVCLDMSALQDWEGRPW